MPTISTKWRMTFHLKSLNIKRPRYDVGNQGPGFGHAQKMHHRLSG
jgi:hypothetical protein